MDFYNFADDVMKTLKLKRDSPRIQCKRIASASMDPQAIESLLSVESFGIIPTLRADI